MEYNYNTKISTNLTFIVLNYKILLYLYWKWGKYGKNERLFSFYFGRKN